MRLKVRASGFKSFANRVKLNLTMELPPLSARTAAAE